jgi:uncharacterized protein YoaH (UPF0181 family)
MSATREGRALDGAPVFSPRLIRGEGAANAIQQRSKLMSTKAQQTYERVEALKADGISQADALKQLAEEFGQSADSVRGAYYTGRRQATGQVSSQGRKRVPKETTAELAIESATAALEQAIDSIEVELATAKNRAEQATHLYEGLKVTSAQRIAAIKAKIAALQDPPVGPGAAAKK